MQQTVLSASPKPIGRPPGASDETRAWRDATRDIARDIPDPSRFAAYLNLNHVQALICSRVGPDGWRIDNGYECIARELRLLGLVEFGGFCLTAFGLKVRRTTIAEDE